MDVDRLIPYRLVDDPIVPDGHKWSVQLVKLDDMSTINDIKLLPTE